MSSPGIQPKKVEFSYKIPIVITVGSIPFFAGAIIGGVGIYLAYLH